MFTLDKLLLLFSFFTAIYISLRFLFRRESLCSRSFLSILAPFSVLSILSLILIRCEAYSPLNVSGALLLLFISAAFFSRKQLPADNRAHVSSNEMTGLFVVVIVLGFFAFYYALYPTYYMIGGRDPGLYLIHAVHIVKTGGLVVDLPFLHQLYEQLGDSVVLGYPGIYSALEYGLSDNAGVLIPQFMHLFSAIGANFYALSEIEGAVRSNAFISFIALCSFFMVMFRLTGYKTALLATAAFALNPAVIWNSRITSAEMLSVAILFFGLYNFMIAMERNSLPWAVCSGLVLGGALLNRLDSTLNVLVVLGYSISITLCGYERRRLALALAFAYLISSSAAFLDGYLHSYPYMLRLWDLGTLQLLLFINYSVSFLSLIVLTLRDSFLKSARMNEKSVYTVMLIFTVLISLWLLYAFFIRPLTGERYEDRALLELSWYVTPFSYVLFTLGFLAAVRERKWERWLPLLILFGATLLIYTWKPRITPDHIWISRRWIPFVIPTLILFSSLSLSRLFTSGEKRGKLFGIVVITFLAGAYVVSSLSFASPYLFKSMLKEYPSKYEKLAQKVKSLDISTPIFTHQESVASVLTYIYGIKTVLISEWSIDSLKSGAFNGYYYIGADDFLRIGVKESVRHSNRVCGQYLEQSKKFPPQRLYERCYSLDLSKIFARAEGYPSVIDVPASHRRFSSQVGIHNNGDERVISTGEEGFLLYGPYIPLNKGRYEVEWFGTVEAVEGDIHGFVDVTAHKGTVYTKKKELVLTVNKRDEENRVAHIEFVLEENTENLEYRFYVRKGIKLTLTRVILRRIQDVYRQKR